MSKAAAKKRGGEDDDHGGRKKKPRKELVFMPGVEPEGTGLGCVYCRRRTLFECRPTQGECVGKKGSKRVRICDFCRYGYGLCPTCVEEGKDNGRVCESCGEKAVERSCISCTKVWYCGAGCQIADRERHESECEEDLEIVVRHYFRDHRKV